MLGENLQTDVSDVGARGGRATIGRTGAIEHGLGIAGQEAEDTGMGARQTRSDLPPGSYEASDELEESSGEMGGYIDQGIEQVGDELDATGAQGNQPDEDLTNRFSRNEAPMGENLQTSGEDMS